MACNRSQGTSVPMTAAVIGTEVPFTLLQAIADLSEEALRRGLSHLQATEFLYETSLFPEHVYTFKHALTQEVAYSSLLQERRRALHAHIVAALEALAGDRLTEPVARLAHHALRGEVWDKAFHYLQQAGANAATRSAYHEAVAYLEQALTALAHLPETHHTREQAVDLRLALRSALLPSRDHGRILAYLREAEACAAALDDPRRLGQVFMFQAVDCYYRGIYDQAIAACQRALALATAGGNVGLHALAHQYLGVVYYFQGNYHQAIDCARQAVTSLEGVRGYERFGFFLPIVVSYLFLAWGYAELGLFAEGRALCEKGLQIAEAVAHAASIMLASWGFGVLYLRQGALAEALPQLERAMGICHEADLPAFFPRIASTLSVAYSLAGCVAEAVPLFTQASAKEHTTAREGELAGFQTLYHLALGEAHLRAGHLEEAYDLAERALALACAHQERGHQAYALRLLGEIAAHRVPLEVEFAEAHYRQSQGLAEALGMRPLQAHCHRGLGTLYATTGQHEQARTALSTAIEMYRAMEMTFWLPETEAALAQVSG